MLGRLGNQVEQDATCRPPRTSLEPRFFGQRVVSVEVGQARDDLVGAPCHLVVAFQQPVHGVAVEHPETRGPVASC
jgi:hypothetical protein